MKQNLSKILALMTIILSILVISLILGCPSVTNKIFSRYLYFFKKLTFIPLYFKIIFSYKFFTEE